MDTPKKDCAIFTIVKNEKIFLPIWLGHYMKYFKTNDIYILDHESNDGSITSAMAGFGINIVPIKNPFAFDHNWLNQTVIDYQKTLLEKYKCVLFAEADELVYSLKGLDVSISEFLSDDNRKYSTCHGYDVIQAPHEPAYESKYRIKIGLGLTTESIFTLRNFWAPNPEHYNKTLLSKIPLTWCLGFHRTDHIPIFKDLFLAHLHRFDFNVMFDRNQRAKFFTFANENPLLGEQNKTFDIVKLINFFNNHAPLELIPEEHINELKRRVIPL